MPVRLAELMMEAGAPAGVLNVVHGDVVYQGVAEAWGLPLVDVETVLEAAAV